MNTSSRLDGFCQRLDKQDVKMKRCGRLCILRIWPPELEASLEFIEERSLWRGYGKEPHGVIFESIEDLEWARKQLGSSDADNTPPQFFDHQLVILEDLGKDWVQTVVDLFKVPLEVFAYHEISPGDYATGRARLPLGERPEQYFFLPYRETLPWKIIEELEPHNEYRLSCGSVRIVGQKKSTEKEIRENATCEAAVSYWATFDSQAPELSGTWTAVILVDPRPARPENGPIIRTSRDTRGGIEGRLPEMSQTPTQVGQVFSPAPELPALQVNKSNGPNHRDRRLIVLKPNAEKDGWQEYESATSISAANSPLSMFEELMISQPLTGSIGPHPLCSTKTVRRLVLAKMSLVVDYFMKRAFVLTYLAMQNINDITEFDFTKLENNPWQDKWRSEFFSKLWELREDIEMLGSEMSRTRRLVKILAELSSNMFTHRGMVRNRSRLSKDFMDLDQWEELEATREYSAQLLQRTTDSYVQAAAAEGAKFANIQAVGSKRVTALASLFVPASLCAAVLAIPNAFQGVNHNQMFWIFWVVSVPLALILALLFYTKLGEWLEKLPLRAASYILLGRTAPMPEDWADLKSKRASKRQKERVMEQENLMRNLPA